MPRKPLTSRPLDLVYFVFFTTHIPASLLCDMQGLYPASLTPAFLKPIIPFYLGMFGDPLIAAANGYYNTPADVYSWTWFKTFVWLELLFQFPIFFIGSYYLYRGSRKIYIPLIIYGASTATTTLACLTTVFSVPSTTNAADALKHPALTDFQRLALIACYVPYMLIPLGMALDMAVRVSKMVDWKKEEGVKKKE
ncbi:hypothetical protein M422DRAFT_774602 [Sphaerobolus stellatus SS14]|nr:hypothetical protein M422DRAFT_774602 [Sphaerobolus stellatus SS14]